MTGTLSENVRAIPDETALRDAIRRKVEAAGTSFYWAMRLLPKERRDGMYAVYAFCREVDDIADDADTAPEQKAAALDAWRSEIDALYEGSPPQRLVGRALRHPVLRYSLRRDDFRAVIDGMEMDAAEDIRAPDMATLDLYCARVAAAVGHLSVHVFGDPSPEAHAVADSLGRALQLTNILRDLDEDARRGRLYLPREILDRHGIRTVEPLEVLRHPALPAACRDLAAIATRHFDEAGRTMARCSRRAMRPAALMGAFYRATLDALVRSEWRDPSRRIGLSKRRKLWLVLRHGIL
ncbi:MAG: presqualene diphosphate synthase HpnD [Alphaproteobacteria bacterium]